LSPFQWTWAMSQEIDFLAVGATDAKPQLREENLSLSAEM